MVDHFGTAAAGLLLAIPTRQQICDLVDAIPGAPQNKLGYNKGPRTFLTITAGGVRISRTDQAKSDETRRRAHDARIRAIDALVREEANWLNEPMVMVQMPGEAKARMDALLEREGITAAPKRGAITQWTRKSKARLEFGMGAYDYTPLFAEGRLPAMVTLTMPGQWWEHCTSDAASFKKKIAIFQRVYRDSWGEMPVGIWKMEFQRRGAPHVHLMMTPPEGVSEGYVHDPDGGDRLVKNDDGLVSSLRTGGLRFQDWLSLTWAKIVGVHKVIGVPNRGQLDSWGAFNKHVNAGTQVTREGMERYSDPRRIGAYFAKHGAYAAKGYQNEMPQLWLDAISQGAGGARFWGAWGLEKAQGTVELNTVEKGGQTKDALSAQHERIIGNPKIENRVTAGQHIRWSQTSEFVERSWETEERRSSATDASVCRAWARDQRASDSADDAKIQRHLRKLARSMAYTRSLGRIRPTVVQGRVMSGAKLVRQLNEKARIDYTSWEMAEQVKSPIRIRAVKYDVVDITTGVVKRVTDYRIGYYTGGSGFLSVNDGRVSANSIIRILGGKPLNEQQSYGLVS